MKRNQAGAALMEFALAWPIVLTLVLGAVQVTVWASENMAARSAALAGARAGSAAGADATAAGEVARRTLSAGLVGGDVDSWCPGSDSPAPVVWVCARDRATESDVEIGGTVPALVPVLFASGLPLRAEASLQKEVFAP